MFQKEFADNLFGEPEHNIFNFSKLQESLKINPEFIKLE